MATVSKNLKTTSTAKIFEPSARPPGVLFVDKKGGPIHNEKNRKQVAGKIFSN